MNLEPSPRSVTVDVYMRRDHLSGVSIHVTRPHPCVSTSLTHQPARSVSRLIANNFTRATQTHIGLFELAVQAARGSGSHLARHRILAILSESLNENLHDTILNWQGNARRDNLLVESKEPLRHLAEANGVFRNHACQLQAVAQPDLQKAYEQMREAVARLGAREDGQGLPKNNSPLGDILRDCLEDRSFFVSKPDGLGQEDDLSVAQMLLQCKDFALRPNLHERSVETGTFVRHGAVIATPLGLAARMQARILEATLTLGKILETLNETFKVNDLYNSHRLSAKSGFGAIEGAYGRIYHAVELAEDDTIAAYAILEPTEWNFHASGPFIDAIKRAQLYNKIKSGERIRQLACLIDPSVEVNVCISEVATSTLMEPDTSLG